MSIRMRPMSCCESGIPIVMMPLDVTHKALTTAKRIEALPRARHHGRHRDGGDARILRALRRAEIRHRRRSAARSLRHRLPAEAGAVQRAATATSPWRPASELTMGMTVDRLVGRDQAAEERDRDARHRPRRLLRAAGRSGWGGFDHPAAGERDGYHEGGGQFVGSQSVRPHAPTPPKPAPRRLPLPSALPAGRPA